MAVRGAPFRTAANGAGDGSDVFASGVVVETAGSELGMVLSAAARLA